MAERAREMRGLGLCAALIFAGHASGGHARKKLQNIISTFHGHLLTCLRLWFEGRPWELGK